MKKLNFYPTLTIEELAWPEEIKAISLATPALNFLTDFNIVKPLVIESSISAIDVKNIMIKAHVRLKFVVNERNHFLGVISVDDLLDQKILHKISEGFKRDEISVTDMMRPKKDLMSLDINELEGSSIGDVIDALKDSGQQHCLVVDRGTNKVRGIFSASDISRMLHLPIDIQDKSSFYKVFSAIN